MFIIRHGDIQHKSQSQLMAGNSMTSQQQQQQQQQRTVILTFVPLASVGNQQAVLHRTRVTITKASELSVVAHNIWVRLEATSAAYYHRRPSDAYVAGLWVVDGDGARLLASPASLWDETLVDEVVVEMAIAEQFGALC